MDNIENADNEEFFIKIFKTFSKNENVIFSPLSLYTALSMVALGAKENTLKEFLSTLNLKSLEDL